MSVSASLRMEILRRDNFTCRYCGHVATKGSGLHVDHKVPRSKGGSDHPSNLVTACKACNLGKSNRTILPRSSADWDTLTGKYFMSLTENGSGKQHGQILARVEDGCYMVQIGSWLTDSPAWLGTQLVHMDKMVTERWAFFDSVESMDEHYMYGGPMHAADRYARQYARQFETPPSRWERFGTWLEERREDWQDWRHRNDPPDPPAVRLTLLTDAEAITPPQPSSTDALRVGTDVLEVRGDEDGETGAKRARPHRLRWRVHRRPTGPPRRPGGKTDPARYTLHTTTTTTTEKETDNGTE